MLPSSPVSCWGQVCYGITLSLTNIYIFCYSLDTMVYWPIDQIIHLHSRNEKQTVAIITQYQFMMIYRKVIRAIQFPVRSRNKNNPFVRSLEVIRYDAFLVRSYRINELNVILVSYFIEVLYVVHSTWYSTSLQRMVLDLDKYFSDVQIDNSRTSGVNVNFKTSNRF